jgi:Cof subfamily protein (haloacid dehalogenase superfamily)
MRKLILIDSDGTLRKTNGDITENTKKNIKKLIELGNYVVICTGRPRYHTRNLAKIISSSKIMICSNGSEIYDLENNKVINELTIDNKVAYKILKYCYKEDIRMTLTIEEDEYVTKDVRRDNQILLSQSNYEEVLKDKKIKQCLFTSDSIEVLKKLKNYLQDFNEIKILNEIDRNKEGQEKWLTIGNVETSKGYALKELANYLDIPNTDTIAIGNDYNDLSMFHECGYSVAVENASKDLKELVDYVTKSNDEDGVSLFLEKLINKEI